MSPCPATTSPAWNISRGAASTSTSVACRATKPRWRWPDARRCLRALGDPGHRFFFALFSLLRFSVSVGLIERPLVQGLIFGLFTGDLTLALQISLFFELFWLDLFPAGTYLPPNATASNLACLALSHMLAATSPAQVAALICVCLPLAPAFSKLDSGLRILANSSYNRLLKWSRMGQDKMRPGRLILKNLTIQFALSFIGFALALGALFAAVSMAAPALFSAFSGRQIGFAHMWVLASLGAVLSLRYRPAQAVLAAGAAMLALGALFA